MKILNVVEIKLITKRATIIEILINNGRMRAIKECKNLHGWDLYKAKRYVDKLALNHPTKTY